MCHFFAIGAPPLAIEAVKQEIGPGLFPAQDYVSDAFEEGTVAYVLDVGVCGCSLYQAPLDEDGLAKMRRKFERRGWTNDRVQRVLDERSKLGGLDRTIVQQVFRCAKKAGRVSLLVFWDDGSELPLRPPVRITADELLVCPWLARENTRLDIVA